MCINIHVAAFFYKVKSVKMKKETYKEAELWQTTNGDAEQKT